MIRADTWPAVLVLENGRFFVGRGVGHKAQVSAEVVFNTAMTGYQEILSDPSYAGQIVVMTAPQIGNTGVTAEDMESARPMCAGLAMRQSSPVTSSWRATGSLPDWLAQLKMPAIEDIDTRAVTRCLRDHGSLRGAISPNIDDVAQIVLQLRAMATMDGQDLATGVSCRSASDWARGAGAWGNLAKQVVAGAERQHVVAVDFGVKHNILRSLYDLGAQVTVVPSTTSAEEMMRLRPDGVFLSNGPGDPAAVGYAVAMIRELLTRDVPIFGICLGHQLLALAVGAKTYKLPFGHHGGNHPVRDERTGRVEITSQNHGFAVDAASLPKTSRVTHVNLYDQTVEGFADDDRNFFAIQYHPEASPGPHDASYLFDRFKQAMLRASR
jgi:carbamoyl-phosphate synthase small subunit